MREWKGWEIKIINKADWSEGLQWVKPEIKTLYCRGEWDKNLFAKAVAVVGARRMTKYGEVMTRQIAAGLTEAGYTIVSGFMYGVDTLAHRTCLENKGKTAAVLGCGLDCLTPAENDNLYTQILQGGGVVLSECQPEQEAKLWTFPYRNRIVAGLSQAVVVIEAGEKSGSLVTAKWAKRQKIPVLAVPGPATGSMSNGTNWLIKNGAKVATDTNDVLEVLGETTRVKLQERFLQFSADEAKVAELLKREALDCDEIGRALSWPADKVVILLSELALNGIIEESWGKFMLGLTHAD